MIAEVVRACSADPLEDPHLARELARRYFLFDAFVAGQRRVDVHPLVLSRALSDGAGRAAEDVARVVGAVAARAHDDEEERAQYRLGPDTVRLASASRAAGDFASLMRVDLLLGEDGAWHACEINADCPGGHNEAYGLPRLARAAGFMRGANPTVAVDAVVARLAELADGGTVGLLYATAYAEDLQVCALLKKMLEERGVPAILAPPTAPRARNGALVIGRTPIRALYRFFPTEWMAGQKNIGDIARAVASGRVRTLSSFAHIYTQSKVSFARAWENAPSLAAEEQGVLARCVPYTVDLARVPREQIVAERTQWVMKRAMGRVGDQVFVGNLFSPDDWAEGVKEVYAARGGGEAWLAQRFVPQRALPTPWGPRYVTLGAYLLDGRFTGYFARITPDTHVSHDALCVPVFTIGET